MNGYDAQDMATQGAEGFRNGYQAGYADAVKAVEVGKPAAAQEAVAWVPPSFFDKGVTAATARRQPPSDTAVALRGEYVPLYRAPVAGAPVDSAVLTNPYTGQPRDYRDVESDPAGTLIVEPGKPLEAASTPAAPGIDLSEVPRYTLAHGDFESQMLEHSRGAWVRLSDVESALLDASHKGGSRGRYFCDGPEGHFFCDDLKLARDLVNAYDKDNDWTITDLQATSAEVGS